MSAESDQQRFITHQEFAVRWLQAIEYCSKHFAESELAPRFVLQISSTNRPEADDKHYHCFLIWLIDRKPASATNPMWVQTLAMPKSEHQFVTDLMLDTRCKYAIMNVVDCIKRGPTGGSGATP